MKMQFIGCGSAFNKVDGQNNVVVIAESGKRLLIDCGNYCWHYAAELGLKPTDFDAVYISHLHADHIGGMEEMAFCTYFSPGANRPKLFCNDNLMHEMWNQSLQGGLASIQGEVVSLTAYFECHPVLNSERFVWEDILFTPIQTMHIMAGFHIKYSYGLLIRENNRPCKTVFFTTDTQFCPKQIMDFYKQADIIFHDCETAPYMSGVHAHYDELVTLPSEIKAKIFPCHYQQNPPQRDDAPDGSLARWKKDGFGGWVSRGDTYTITSNEVKVESAFKPTEPA
jgi:ribonuclease BN (tRNA processing enzyme)